MKIDISTVLIVIICVIPGLFAQRSRNSVCPKSFEDQGTSAELGELVALGIATHGVIAVFAAFFLFVVACIRGFAPLYFFHRIDSWQVEGWCSNHSSEAIVLATMYVFLSFAVSHWLGLAYGVWRFRSPVTTTLLRHSKWLQRLGINGLIVEKPIIYEALSARRRDSDGLP